MGRHVAICSKQVHWSAGEVQRSAAHHDVSFISTLNMKAIRGYPLGKHYIYGLLNFKIYLVPNPWHIFCYKPSMFQLMPRPKNIGSVTMPVLLCTGGQNQEAGNLWFPPGPRQTSTTREIPPRRQECCLWRNGHGGCAVFNQ